MLHIRKLIGHFIGSARTLQFRQKFIAETGLATYFAYPADGSYFKVAEYCVNSGILKVPIIYSK